MRLWLSSALLLTLACSSDGPTRAPAFRHEAFFDSLEEASENFHRSAGEWHQDYGDASFFGVAFHARHVRAFPETPRAELEASHARIVNVVSGADLINGDLNEIAMSALGWTEYIGATGDTSGAEGLTAMVRQMNSISWLLGYYLDGEATAGFAQDLYGATSLSAFVAILNLQHAYYIEADREEFVAVAREAVAAIDELAWRDGYYSKARDSNELYLYPNITMMSANARLYALTGERAFLDRAVEVYGTIQSLREVFAAGVRYRSPYLRDYMGLSTDNVATLSAQNYLMLALVLMWEQTGENAYLEEVDRILDGLSGELFDQFCHSWLEDFQVCDGGCGDGQSCVVDRCEADRCGPGVLHHWIDGAIATPVEGDMFCSGCNLQTLFIMEMRRGLTAPPGPLVVALEP
ncbi:MAG: hypothetical protein AAF411_25190 [Myxococcota bacterium]